MKRFFVVTGAIAAVLVLSWILVLGAAVAWSGVATIRIDDADEGVDLFLPIPMAAVEAAVVSASWGHRDRVALELDTHLGELAEYDPFLRAILAELENCPDATLVEVQDHESSVSIRKRGGHLEIDVNDIGARIEISLPMRSVRRTVDRLARLY